MSHHPDVISGKITAKEAYQLFLSHFDTHSSSTRTSKVLAVSYAVNITMCVIVMWCIGDVINRYPYCL